MSQSTFSRIDSLEKLQMEKVRLESQCAYQEKLIGLKVDYFRDNYPKILADRLLPNQEPQKAQVGSLLDSVNSLLSDFLPGIFKSKFPALILRVVQVMMIRMFARK